VVALNASIARRVAERLSRRDLAASRLRANFPLQLVHQIGDHRRRLGDHRDAFGADEGGALLHQVLRREEREGRQREQAGDGDTHGDFQVVNRNMAVFSTERTRHLRDSDGGVGRNFFPKKTM
jgi:hypothetical protein